MSLFVVPGLSGQQYAPYPPAQPPDPQPGYGQSADGQPDLYGGDVSSQQPNSAPSYPDDAQSAPQQGYGAGRALSEQQLEQLVAPVALYPDSLVAQILAASTYPAQVSQADQWRWSEGNAPAEQIVAGAEEQQWDPSVKALTAFPQVLSEMGHNLPWVTDLGNAYYNQPQDVLHAVQVMRWRAQAAGNLRSTLQEPVTYDQGNIVLGAANTQFAYVPEYNPWLVYGAPVNAYPGFSLLGAVGSLVSSAAMRFAGGIATAAFSHSPFGLLAWALNWLGQGVLFHGSTYYSHSTTVRDWGLPHGGPRAFYRSGTFAGRSYRETGIYGRWSGSSANPRSPGFYRAPYSAPNRNPYARSRLPEESRGWQGGGARDSRLQEDGFRGFRQPMTRSEIYSRSSSALGFDNRGMRRSGNDLRYENRMQANRSSLRGFKHNDLGRPPKNSNRDGFGWTGKRERRNNHFRTERAPKRFAKAKSLGHSHSGHGHGGKRHG